jgi:hypothetical protein
MSFAVAVLRTPPQFWLADRWLQDNPCPDRMSYDQTLDFVDNVPVSIETRVALKSCLFEAKPGFFSPVESATAVFERPEVVHKLLTKGKEGKVQVTLVGRRRLGKTMSVPHAVVEARAQVCTQCSGWSLSSVPAWLSQTVLQSHGRVDDVHPIADLPRIGPGQDLLLLR